MQTTLAAYAAIAAVYAGEEAGEDDPRLRARMRELFRERLPGPRVLELGCGPGTDAAALAADGLEVTASDGCPAFLEVVRRRYPSLPTLELDLRGPLPAGPWDGIYGFACFVHLPRAAAAAALAAYRAALRPGGVLFLGLIRSERVAEYWIDGFGGDPAARVLFSCWAPAAFQALLQGAGFREVEVFTESAPIYETMPRLVERGVTLFQVRALA